jgi:hypothetical protein
VASPQELADEHAQRVDGQQWRLIADMVAGTEGVVLAKSHAAGVLALAVVFAVTGCTTGQNDAGTAVHVLRTYRGTALSQTTPSSSDAHPTVYWITGRREVALSTYGSSGCPLVPLTVQVMSPTHVTLRMRDYGARACSADLAATTSEFALPSALSRRATVRVTLAAKDAATGTLQLRVDPTVASRGD